MLFDPLTPFEQADLVASMRRIEAMLAEPEPGEPLVLRRRGWARSAGSSPPGAALPSRTGLECRVRDADHHHLRRIRGGPGEPGQGPLGRRPGRRRRRLGLRPARGRWHARDGAIAHALCRAHVPRTGDRPAPRRPSRGLFQGSGYRHLMLWTQDCLVSAGASTKRRGSGWCGEERHRSFGADLNGQFWQLDL